MGSFGGGLKKNPELCMTGHKAVENGLSSIAESGIQ